MAKRISPLAAARLASAADLMGTGDQLAIPRLEGVPLEYLYSAGDSALIVLARTLVELGLAVPEDWESPVELPSRQGDPYVRMFEKMFG